MKFDRDTFWAEFRPFYKGIGGKLTDAQVENIEFLLREFENSDEWQHIPHVAYAFATLHIETYVPKKNLRYGPVTEVGPKSYFNKYEPNTKIGRSLGNTQPGDGYKYRGRGYQLTGRKNYTKISKALGRDLVNDPELANDPFIAFDAFTWGIFNGIYTGKKLTDYINPTKKDYKNARRTYNGLDRADEIARIAQGFEVVLTKAASVVKAEAPVAVETVDVPREKPSLFVVIGSIFTFLTGVGINAGQLIQQRLTEATPLQFLIAIGGIGLIVLAIWWYRKSAKAAQVRNLALIEKAADPTQNTVNLKG